MARKGTVIPAEFEAGAFKRPPVEQTPPPADFVSRRGKLVAQTGGDLFLAPRRVASDMTARKAAVLPFLRHPVPELPLDRELCERALAGESLASQLLYRRHVHAVTERVTRLLARSSEAEDVVQDTFVEALAGLAGLEDRARFGAWLMRIAVHQVHRRFRRRRLLARLGLDRGSDDAGLENVADPGLDPERRLQLRRLDSELGRLPVALRLAWMLRYVEGCELSDAAAQCGCSLATFKRRIQQADARLRARLVEASRALDGRHV
jgi:RNA polymerase sigma-70 factor, ECF subfamily